MDRHSRSCLELEDYFKDSLLRPSEGDFFQQYRITDWLGCGTYGTVYNAVKLSNEEEEVVVKIVHKKRAKKVTVGERTLPVEALALHKLQGVEGIFKFLGFFESKSRFFIVMESRPKHLDLLEVLDLGKGRRLAERTAKHIIHQVAKTLAAMKQRGLTHGDVKSANVIVDFITMEVFLIDFGAVEVAKDTNFLRSLRGTRAYVPPEAKDCDGCWDGDSYTVFGFGVLLHQLLFGSMPFPATESGSAVTKERVRMLGKRIMRFKGVSREAKTLVYRCLHFDPMHRIKLEAIELNHWFYSGWEDTPTRREWDEDIIAFFPSEEDKVKEVPNEEEKQSSPGAQCQDQDFDEDEENQQVEPPPKRPKRSTRNMLSQPKHLP